MRTKTYDVNALEFLNMTLQEILLMIANTGGDQLETVVRLDMESEIKITLKVEEVDDDR